jgi:hypothetical protein
MKVEVEDVQAVQAGAKFVPVVEPVEGTPWALWVDRRGDLHLTPSPNRSTLNSQVATVEGSGS